jgi:isopenicillin N synthase-like dioxygenase
MAKTAFPVVDIASMLRQPTAQAPTRVVADIGRACRAHGFFDIAGHGIDDGLQADLREASCRAGWLSSRPAKLMELTLRTR